MALFDVAPVLEGVASLQEKVEDAITKSKLLLEAVEGSQSKYTELSDEYPVLRSLKGRLAASQGPNEALSTELVKFKLELESFVEEVFNAHDQVRKDLKLWANELDRDNTKLRREREELANERRKLEVDRRDFDAQCLAAASKEQQITEARTVTSTDDTDQTLSIVMNNYTDHYEEDKKTKSAPSHVTRDVECQTEAKVNLAEETGEEDIQTAESIQVKDEEDRLEMENYPSLRCRSQLQTATIGRSQHILTAPVSRAKALLFKKQDHALRIHQMVLDDITKVKEENQLLKTENSLLSKRANEATADLFHLKNKMTINMSDRDELYKKLLKSKEQILKLEQTLRRQALGLVSNLKEQRQLQEEIRWSQIFALPLNQHSSQTKRIPRLRPSTRGR